MQFFLKLEAFMAERRELNTQISLPLSKALEISFNSVKTRFGSFFDYGEWHCACHCFFDVDLGGQFHLWMV